MKKKAKTWKKVSSRRLLDHSLHPVDEDIVKLPNGKETKYIVHPSQTDSVAVIAINSKHEILLQKEYSYPPDIIMWQLPGGSMETGETVEQAALRELAEETGYSAHIIKQIGYFYVQNRRTNKRQFVTICEKLFPYKLKEDEDEFIDTYWVPVADLPHMISRCEFNNINLLAALNLWFHRKEI